MHRVLFVAVAVVGLLGVVPAEDAPCPLVVQWARQFGGGSGAQNLYESANASASLPGGRIVAVGSFKGTAVFDGFPAERFSAGDSDAFVVSYGRDGTAEWLRTLGGTGEDSASGCAPFPDGSVVVAGWFKSSNMVFGQGEPSETVYSSAGASDTFLARFRSDGSLAWAKRITAPSYVNPRAVAAHADGGFYVCGYHVYSGATFGPGEPNQHVESAAGAFVARYNEDGTLRWVRLLGGGYAGDAGANALGLCATADGGCAVSGTFIGTGSFETQAGQYTTMTASGYIDCFFGRYDADGNLVWLKRAGGPSTDHCVGISEFPDGSVAVCGSFSDWAVFGPGEAGQTTVSSAGGQDAYVARLLQDGSLAWVRSARGVNNEEAGTWVQALPGDTCLFTGHIGGYPYSPTGVTFGQGEANETTLPWRGSVDTFLAHYSLSGSLLCVNQIGGPDAEVGYSIQFAPPQYVVFSGFFAGTVNFGVGGGGQAMNLTSRGARDGFLVRYLLSSLPQPNVAPVVDAGPGLAIFSIEQDATTLHGTASDADGDAMQFRWTNGGEALTDWGAVVDGLCPLDLGGLPSFAIGDHLLALEVSDGKVLSIDETVLTVENSPPVAAPTGVGVYEIGADYAVPLGGTAADDNGDTLLVTWREGGTAIFAQDAVATVAGGDPVALPDHSIPTLSLGVGLHQIELVVDDGVNEPVSAWICVEVMDSTAPTLSPTPSMTILWPPNHTMVDVTIVCNAADNSGGPLSISVLVSSSDPANGAGDGTTAIDYEIVSIDQATGVIVLRLRSERSGRGDGRIYTVLVSATDESGIGSTAAVEIRAPRDRGAR